MAHCEPSRGQWLDNDNEVEEEEDNSKGKAVPVTGHGGA
jgi:hypothetical protein